MEHGEECGCCRALGSRVVAEQFQLELCCRRYTIVLNFVLIKMQQNLNFQIKQKRR
jgi:hypothetical protein